MVPVRLGQAETHLLPCRSGDSRARGSCLGWRGGEGHAQAWGCCTPRIQEGERLWNSPSHAWGFFRAGCRAKATSGKALTVCRRTQVPMPPTVSPPRGLGHVPCLWSHCLTVKSGWADWLATLSSAHVHTQIKGCLGYCYNSNYYLLVLMIL